MRYGPTSDSLFMAALRLSRIKKDLKNYWENRSFISRIIYPAKDLLDIKTREHAKGMKLILDNNIFFEFVPFDDKNFDHEGNIIPDPEVKMIHEVEEGKEYALLMSTNSGAWRYLIGDTVRFVDIEQCEVAITGRTKHFLSLIGEHLSVENMNKAIELVSEELNISIPEYTVVGFPYQNFFAHKWYIASNDNCNTEILKNKIDRTSAQAE